MLQQVEQKLLGRAGNIAATPFVHLSSQFPHRHWLVATGDKESKCAFQNGHLAGDKLSTTITAFSDTGEEFSVGGLIALFIQLFMATVAETALKKSGNRATMLWIPVKVNKPARFWSVSFDVVFRHAAHMSPAIFQTRLWLF